MILPVPPNVSGKERPLTLGETAHRKYFNVIHNDNLISYFLYFLTPNAMIATFRAAIISLAHTVCTQHPGFLTGHLIVVFTTTYTVIFFNGIIISLNTGALSHVSDESSMIFFFLLT